METLLNTLKERFIKHPHRHNHVQWEEVEKKIIASPMLLKAIAWMEETGGEPDVAVIEEQIYYIDFSKETPKGRTNVCFDLEARTSRKKFPPLTSTEEMMEGKEVHLLHEEMYKDLQEIEDLDLKTSSWLSTPLSIRQLGGALFGDKRYGRTFIYHNGADSYYSVRSFRVYTLVK